MKLNKIIISNFMSFEFVEYSFVNYCTLIQGRNLTDQSQETNGTGKTSFQSAIEYALTGNTSQKIKDVDLIRYGQLEACVKLFIDCSARNQTMIIKRRIIRGKSSKVSIEINDQLIDLATVNDANHRIFDWLQISKDDLQNYFIVNKERYRNFFQTSHTDKVKIISRFSKANLIDGVEEYVNKEVDGVHNVKCKNTERLNTLYGKLVGYEESLNYELNRDLIAEKQKVVDNLNQKKKDINDKYEHLENHVVDSLIEITNANTEKENLKQLIDLEIVKIADIRCDDLQNNLNSYTKQIEQASSERDNLKDKIESLTVRLRDLRLDITEIEQTLVGMVQCPNCKHEFHPSDKAIDVDEEKKVQTELKNAVAEISLQYGQVNDDYENLIQVINQLYKSRDNEQKELSVVQKQITDRQNKISRYQNEIDNYNSQIKSINISSVSYTEAMNECIEQIETIDEEIEKLDDFVINKNRIDDLRLKITNANIERTELETSIEEDTDKIFKIGQWIFNFKQFQNYLANKFLNVITSSCNNYLAQIDSNIKVRFDGYKHKVDGSLSERINAIVTRDNQERDFNSFSGGERARLELCVIFTIRDLINAAHPYGGLDFLFTDEIFEGLDGKGLSQLTTAAQNLASTTLITTHVNDNQIHDHILTIEKTNGISKLYAS